MCPKSDSGDDKVVQLSARRAPSLLERRLSGIEPDALYVFRLGPLDTQEGRCHAYLCILGEGTPSVPEIAESNAEGLARLAPHFQGRRVYCEPKLARAGARYGLISRPFPPELIPLRAFLALSTEWGLSRSDAAPELLDLFVQLLAAAKGLWHARPWTLWSNVEVARLRLEGVPAVWRELCLLGNAGEAFGFALYARPGFVERLGRLSDVERLQASLDEGALSLTFHDEPAWVRSAVKQVSGLPLFPSTLRLADGAPAPVRRDDLLVLLAVMRALKRLSPEQLELREEVVVGGQRVIAHVRAPMPLFTAWLPSPPLPRRAGPPTPEAAPIPPVPRRKISATLIDFIEPLMPEPGAVALDEFMMRVELAVTTWNAVVLDTWEPGPDRVGAVRAAVRTLPGDLRAELVPFFEALVTRKRSHFQQDARVMSGLEVHWAPNGEPRIRLQWRLPGSG